MSQPAASQSMIVKAKCSLQRGHFAINFIEYMPGSWGAEKTFRISQDRATRGFSSGTLSGIHVSPKYGGCPYCENKTFFLCNNCRTLNCQGSSKKYDDRIFVSCTNCGPIGYLEGQIEKLEGHGDL